MEKLVISIGLVAVIITALLWVSGISYMRENHPDYKAEDFLEDDEDK
jgi:hypothetical protein